MSTWNILTDLDKREISDYYMSNSHIHHEIRQEYLSDKYNVTKRTVRNWLSRLGLTQNTYDKLITSHPQYVAAKERRVPKSQVYIITWEQNKTPIVERFWENILAYAEFRGAYPIVIQGRYQNPTSIWKDQLSNEGWSHATSNFQYNSRISIHPYLEIMADMKIVPTASKPLSSLNNMTGLNTGIVGHPKLHLQPTAVPRQYRNKAMLTTGAITLPNYTDSKAGLRGESKHKLGFVIVEIKDDEVFFIRQVEADESGEFYDLFYRVRDKKITRVNEIEGIVFGDTHAGSEDTRIQRINRELIELLNPKKLVYHDIIDGLSVNNHLHKKPLAQFKRYQKGQHLIYQELENLKEFLYTIKREGSFIVRSNHDTRFERYIDSVDWRKDIPNAQAYAELLNILLNDKGNRGIIPYYVDKWFPDGEYTCLGLDDSLIIGKYECAMHGHLGSNGTRGSISQFYKMDIPAIVAHRHTVMRMDDIIMTGTNSKLDLGYNVGPSDWMHSNTLVHPNGIAQQIIIIDSEYTTQKDV